MGLFIRRYLHSIIDIVFHSKRLRFGPYKQKYQIYEKYSLNEVLSRLSTYRSSITYENFPLYFCMCSFIDK